MDGPGRSHSSAYARMNPVSRNAIRVLGPFTATLAAAQLAWRGQRGLAHLLVPLEPYSDLDCLRITYDSDAVRTAW